MRAPIRELDIDDLDIRSIEGDGVRVLLAFLIRNDGNDYPDSAVLLGMAQDVGPLFDVIGPLVRVQEYSSDPVWSAGFLLPGTSRLNFGRASEDTGGFFQPDDTLVVVSAPLEAGLDLYLQGSNLLNLPKLEIAAAPSL